MPIEQKSERLLHPEGLTEAQERLALSLFDAGVIQFDFEKGWRLTSPEMPPSPFYIDLRLLQSKLEVKQEVVTTLIEQVEGLKYDCLAGIPLAAVFLASSMADRIRKPQITPRMDLKTHGERRRIDGVFQKGEIALVIDDVLTRAKSKLEAIEILEGNGLVVRDVVVVVDREQGGKEQLAERGYALYAVLKIKPILNFYARIGKITQEELNRVFAYLAAP